VSQTSFVARYAMIIIDYLRVSTEKTWEEPLKKFQNQIWDGNVKKICTHPGRTSERHTAGLVGYSLIKNAEQTLNHHLPHFDNATNPCAL